MQLSEKVLIKMRVFILTPPTHPRSLVSLPVLGYVLTYSLSIPVEIFITFSCFSLLLLVGSILPNIALIRSLALAKSCFAFVFKTVFDFFYCKWHYGAVLEKVWVLWSEVLSLIPGSSIYILWFGASFFSALLNLSFFICEMKIILTIVWLWRWIKNMETRL